ncbi:hypothetical protein [Microlunatus soli]|uniref:Uncharacterized protein n=1 Tax=Microlunatus soli TaxID=630515 RepID=A0A1H1Y9M0_9ACTN|nr:hypothetical protein [Microlunatus soli]SDT18091.1 hypothetical protein SAMN04489812_4463 [Microlunatus soli]
MVPADHDSSARIWSLLPAEVHQELAEGLSPTDLQSLLIDVAGSRAAEVTPARLMQRWRSDRFVRPAGSDPRRLSAVVARLWQLLPAQFEGIELAPVTPLGTCSAMAAVDQNRVLSTTRTSEVVSDLTNVLALEAATRRRTDRGAPVHLAACHRVLRSQQFAAGASHFELFALVSSDRDRGSARTEADLLAAHLRYWTSVLEAMLPGRPAEIRYAGFEPALRERYADTVLPALRSGAGERVEWIADHDRARARHYYSSGALLIHADGVELGDGGFTDWTARLLADRKERCLISCLSTEGLVALESLR